jgi:hypothetical protein
MKEWMKLFLAIASVLGGAILSIARFINSFINGRNDWGRFNPDAADVTGILVGIALIAAGITYFWTQNRIYKG